jgi:hypothetical protein
MTKEVGEITSEMEGNLSSSTKFFKELRGSDFCKEIGRGILGK